MRTSHPIIRRYLTKPYGLMCAILRGHLLLKIKGDYLTKNEKQGMLESWHKRRRSLSQIRTLGTSVFRVDKPVVLEAVRGVLSV